MQTNQTPPVDPKKVQAILVTLSFGMCSLGAEDKEATEEVKLKKNAKEGGCSVKAIYFSKEALEKLTKHRSVWKKRLALISLPWDTGTRLLPVKNFERWKGICAEMGPEQDALKQDFIDMYEGHVADAKDRMGTLFDETTFPTVKDIQAEVRWKVREFAIPAADAVARLEGLSAEAAQAIAESTDQRVKHALEEGQLDTWKRIMEPLKILADRLANPDAKLFESFIDNLRDVAERVPTLNLINDPKLNEFASGVKSTLAGIDIAKVKKDGALRQHLTTEAKQLIAGFGEFTNRSILS